MVKNWDFYLMLVVIISIFVLSVGYGFYLENKKCVSVGGTLDSYGLKCYERVGNDYVEIETVYIDGVIRKVVKP